MYHKGFQTAVAGLEILIFVADIVADAAVVALVLHLKNLY
jgi:hypothetical protein